MRAPGKLQLRHHAELMVGPNAQMMWETVHQPWEPGAWDLPEVPRSSGIREALTCTINNVSDLLKNTIPCFMHLLVVYSAVKSYCRCCKFNLNKMMLSATSWPSEPDIAWPSQAHDTIWLRFPNGICWAKLNAWVGLKCILQNRCIHQSMPHGTGAHRVLTRTLICQYMGRDFFREAVRIGHYTTSCPTANREGGKSLKHHYCQKKAILFLNP